MKNLIFGLAVATIALGASAFTNAKSDSTRLTTAYITGFAPGTGQTVYTFSYDEQPNCGSGENPCQVETVGSYTLPVAPATLEIPVSDVIPENLDIISAHDF